MTRTIVIFADADAYRVAELRRAGDVSVTEVPVTPDASPDARAGMLAEALKAGGFAARAVLALASAQCLCATISTAGLPARQRGQAMLYRFEEKLPVAAEDIAADFVVAGQAAALAIGVERRVIDPLVEAVRLAGVRLRAVSPASLLTLQEWTADRSVREGDHWLCWRGTPGTLELFRLSEREPVAWYVTADGVSDVTMHLRAAGGASPRMAAYGMSAGFAEDLRSAGIIVDTAETSGARDAAIRSATMMFAAKRVPWIDLANSGRGSASSSAFAVAEGSGRAAIAALAVFSICLLVALFTRAARYERLAGRYESEQGEVFRRLFPDAAIPVDVRSRLASEARAAGGVGGAGVNGSSGRDGNGLLVLRDVLTYLPAETRFRVTELRLEDRAFTLEGDVPSHGDAEAIAGALRRRTGFAVDSPRTEQRGQTVAFTINGRAGTTSSRQHDAADVSERRASR